VFDLLQATGLEGGRSNLATELGKEYGMDDIGRLTSGPMAGYSILLVEICTKQFR
jgi:hypothetical protein